MSDPLTALVLGTAVGAPAALVPHAAKTALRAASTDVHRRPGEPGDQPRRGRASFVLFVLAILVPLVVVGLLAIALLLIPGACAAASPVTAA